MTVRLMLVSPASSDALREARFDDDSPLDAAGVRRAAAVVGTLPAASSWFASPTVRCRQTADALGLVTTEDRALADQAVGRWRGLRLAEVAETEPQALAAWLTDPTAAPHGGESLLALCDRVGGWLDARAGDSGRVLAVVEPGVVRAALVHALGLPASLFWRLDVAPLTGTELTGRAGRWNLRCGLPLQSTAVDAE